MKRSSPNGVHTCFTSAPTPDRAVMRLLEDGPSDAGQPTLAVLEVDHPLSVEAGDRFIIRDSGRQMVIGGGTVLDPDPPRRRRDALTLGRDLTQALERGPDAVASVMLNQRRRGSLGRSRRSIGWRNAGRRRGGRRRRRFAVMRRNGSLRLPRRKWPRSTKPTGSRRESGSVSWRGSRPRSGDDQGDRGGPAPIWS